LTKRGELGALTVATRGTKTVAAQVDVSAAWRSVGEEYGLSRDRADALFTDRVVHEHRDVRGDLLADLTRERSMVEDRLLEARALELVAGAERPEQAREHVEELVARGELIELEGGWFTTRQLRELEQRTLATAADRATERAGVVSASTRDVAIERSEARLGATLTYEQRQAFESVTGPGGVVVLVGEAGTGKGVVLGAAREAWQQAGYRVIGTAVAGAAAQRLGSEAGVGETLTADALTHRVEHGQVELDHRSVVVFDEAGMADTRRLAAMVELTRQADAKLVLAGDAAQLSPIGAGGLFRELQDRVPTATVSEVHRANHEWERQAWANVRAGDAESALGAYQEHGRLHLEDTREQAGERMVGDWAAVRDGHPGERVVMLTDASNHELDRLNEQAQQHRADRGELGDQRVELPERPYGLATNDEVLFAGQHRVPGDRRVENGTRGQVVSVDDQASSVRVRTEEPTPREVDVPKQELNGLRLSYAQHVYKAQGLTTDRALVLTGGWQTDRERAYVSLTRAREQTDVYAARDDLGHEGIDSDAIDRLAERMSESHAQQASVTRAQTEEPTQSDREEPSFAERLHAAHNHQPDPLVDRSRERDGEPRSWFAQQLEEIRSQQVEQALDRDRGEGIEI
jgi:ATP-dependent exoDNAse (exonuclease V) alpha subunit